MAALSICFRSRLRLRWRALLGLVLLVGLAGGACMAALAAAHRTDTAFDRMVVRTNAYQLMINPDSENYTPARFEQIRQLPEVAQAGEAVGNMLMPSDAHTLEDADNSTGSLSMLRGEGTIGRSVVRSGRWPNPASPTEVFVDQSYADAKHLKVGDRIPVRVMPGGIASLGDGPSADAGFNNFFSGRTGTLVSLVVAGIGVQSDSIVLDQGFSPPGILTTAAFWRTYRQPSFGWWGTEVTLKPGADEAAFRRKVEAMFEKSGGVVFQTRAATRVKVQRAVAPQVAALQVFAAILAIVGLTLVGQAMSRHLHNDGLDNPTLAAVGSTRRDRLAVNLATVVLVAVVGAALGLVLAVFASPIAPVGVVRAAEPHPGWSLDAMVLLPAAAAVVLLLVALSLIPAWRAAAVVGTGGVARHSRTATTMAQAGLPVPAVAGVRFALEPGHGRTAVPVRSTLLAAVGAVAVVASAMTFSSSLDHLVSTPRLYGSDWQVVVAGDSTQSDDNAGLSAAVARVLAQSPKVTGYALGLAGEVTLSGRPVPAMALQQGSKPIHFTIVDGRAPQTPDEIVLGTATMHDLGTSVGGTVTAAAPPDAKGATPAPSTLHVVGRAVLPGIGTYSGSDKTALGRGAILTPAGLQANSPVVHSTQSYLVRVTTGVSNADLKSLVKRSAVMPAGVDWYITVGPTLRPSDIVSLVRLRATPLVLSGLLVLLMAGTVANALLAAIRRRRRDLAVLEVMGASRRQILATVAWQASTIALVGIVVGVPAGIVAGRVAWNALASSLGTIAEPTLPGLALALLAVIVLALANLVSLFPGLRAVRTTPATALRSE